MVYYFQSNVIDPPAFIYVGKDKVESRHLSRRAEVEVTDEYIDEDLIKFGWEEDVWYGISSIYYILQALTLSRVRTPPQGTLSSASN